MFHSGRPALVSIHMCVRSMFMTVWVVYVKQMSLAWGQVPSAQLLRQKRTSWAGTEVMAALMGERKGKWNRSSHCWRKWGLLVWMSMQTCGSLCSRARSTERRCAETNIWSACSTHSTLELQRSDEQWHISLYLFIYLLLCYFYFFEWVNLSVVQKSEDVQGRISGEKSSFPLGPLSHSSPT